MDNRIIKETFEKMMKMQKIIVHINKILYLAKIDGNRAYMK
jgi:hypothetical protein